MSIDGKPSRNEDEYFIKRDAELIKEQRARLDAERAAREKQQHYMKCPKCGADLAERELQHVKVDVCGDCGGMWLDKGEMNLLRSTGRGGLSSFVGSLFGVEHK
jgi:ribosomal protein L37AE/L43A